jgi:hypothetical protein
MTATLSRPTAAARWSRSDWRSWNLAAVAALTAYSTGVAWQAQFVSYPLFGRLSAAEFPAYHLAYNEAIPGVVVIPGFLTFVVCIAFLFTRPADTSRTMAGLIALTGLGSVLSTVLWAIPMHDQLDRIGQDAATLRSLLTANAVRTAFLTVGTVGLFGIIARKLGRAG